MKFRVRSKPKAEMQWYKGNQKIRENEKFKSKYIELGNDEYEVLLEILVSSNFSLWIFFVEKIRPFRSDPSCRKPDYVFCLSEPVCWRRRWLQVRGEEWPWATSGQTQPQHRGWAGGSISGVGVGRASRRRCANIHRETKNRHARQRQTCSDDRQVRSKGYDITIGKFVTNLQGTPNSVSKSFGNAMRNRLIKTN